jgi:hypothetical protein
MGNAETLRGRLTPAVVVAVLLALAVIVTLGVMARPAEAQATFTQCSSCHAQSATHSNPSHAGFFGVCSTCHTNGTDNPPPPSACAACHGGTTAILARTTHAAPAQACGTTPGCHGVPAVTPVTTTMTLKAAPTTQRLGRSVKFSGVAGSLPALAGAKVAFKVERKVGTKWVKMKTAAKTVNATTGAFSWTYKTVKKGAHRVTASIAAKAGTYTAKKMVKSFKVR